MAKEKIITAIDVGSTKISTIVSAVTENKISVIGVSGGVVSKGVNKGNIVDIDNAVESIANSLERAERMAGVAVSSAFVIVNGSHIESLNSHGVVAVSHQSSEITAEDVGRVTEAAQAVSLPSTREIVHVIPRDFVVDSQDGIKDPLGMSGVRLEVETNIIHGSTTAIKNLIKCVEQTGVSVEGLVYAGLAGSEAVLTDTEKELGTVLLDIGGGTTSVISFVEGSPVFSRVLPIGAKHITNDLAIGLRARLEDAERIKLRLSEERTGFSAEDQLRPNEEIDVSEFGLETDKIQRKFLYNIINARLDEIFSLVALELQSANLLKKLPAGVVIAGGGAKTYGIERVARNSLKMPVRVGLPRGVTGLIDEIQGPEFSASVGGLMYGFNLMRSGAVLSFDGNKGKIGNVFGKLLEKTRSFLP